MHPGIERIRLVISRQSLVWFASTRLTVYLSLVAIVAMLVPHQSGKCILVATAYNYRLTRVTFVLSCASKSGNLPTLQELFAAQMISSRPSFIPTPTFEPHPSTSLDDSSFDPL